VEGEDMTGAYRIRLQHTGCNWKINNVTGAYRISLEHTRYKWRPQNITGANRMWVENKDRTAAHRIAVSFILIHEFHSINLLLEWYDKKEHMGVTCSLHGIYV
jgi:hypothetical protein